MYNKNILEAIRMCNYELAWKIYFWEQSGVDVKECSEHTIRALAKKEHEELTKEMGEINYNKLCYTEDMAEWIYMD